MTITITWQGALLTALAIAGVVLLIYLIVVMSKLLETLKKTNQILEDAKVISAIAADKAQKLDKVIDGMGESVGTVVDTLKGNKSVISAATNVVNAASNLAGVVKKAEKKGKKKEAED